MFLKSDRGRPWWQRLFAVLVLSAGVSALLVSSAAASGWSRAASMATARARATATLLASGKVLVVGGTGSYKGGDDLLSSAELYDAATNRWSSAASMSTARVAAAAALLPSGKVLVAGGSGALGDLASAELYDPASNTWSSAGNMAAARVEATATLLHSGKVLVVGGTHFSGCCPPLASAELYDPATNSWSSAGSMHVPRWGHTATLLRNGQVLVAGGEGVSSAVASAELYDPATNRWSSTGRMIGARSDHTATLLPSGKVLVAGGDVVGAPLAGAELYDPATKKWSSAGTMAAARSEHTATLLPTGKVLVAGGAGAGSQPLASAELYDPATKKWSSAGHMATARYWDTATLLPRGQVLVAGGMSDFLSSAELYTPAPVASVPGRVSSRHTKLTFTFTCQGATGDSCHGLTSAITIEKLSANGRITGVLSRKPRAGRYRIVMILKETLSAATGQSKNVALGLNSTGQKLSNRFKNIPSKVMITTTAGTIRTANVTFRR